MLIRSLTMESIRHQFTAEEKTMMNLAITGQVVCPRGVTLDEAMLPAELQGKLKAAVEGVR